MADTPTATTLDISGSPTASEILSPQSTTPATQVSTEDGWDIEDTGRVRGDNFDSVVKAEQDVAKRADGSDPTALGDPDLPEPDITDDTDAGVVARTMDPDGHAAKPGKAKGEESRGKLKLSRRVEKLRERVDTETKTYRERQRINEELQRGNIELARKLLAEAEPSTEPGREVRQPATTADTRPRRPDGTFAARSTQADPEPKVPAKPTRPVWEQYDEEGKTWAEYNKDLAAYDDAREAYLEARAEHKAWQVRQDLSGEIAKRDQRMTEITRATQRERADAAFAARRSVVMEEYGKDRWNAVVQNWAEYDKAGYQSDALETLFQLHEQGPKIMGALGEKIEAAAALADRDWTMDMFDGIMALEDPTPVLIALADDPEAFDRISSLPRSKAVAALGALAGRLEVAGHRAHGSRPAPVSKAPAPIRPVGGRREGGSTRTGDAAFSEDVPFEEYVRETNERVRGRS